ncbi:MAG: lactate utilization protein [Patescibacteria group bacterium]
MNPNQKNNWNKLPEKKVLDKTIAGLEEKGYEVFLVDNSGDALGKIKTLIPQGTSVMNGSSTTLKEIGFIDYLKSGKHGWDNLHEKILAEKDPAKQKVLLSQAFTSDYYLGSVHALVENGEFIIASNTASQLPHVVHTSPNLIFVVGTQKIVADLASAMRRLEEHVIPLENQRAMKEYGSGTTLNKILIFKGESPYVGRKIKFILVNQKLGF